MHERDVFICHAGPDKLTHVQPLVNALKTHGISYWLDEAEIQWGQSIISKVNQGLSNSKFVIVFLTAAFLDRNFPEAELNSALSIELRTGRTVVLPILIAPEELVFRKYPLLASKMYLKWIEGMPKLVEQLLTLLDRPYKTQWSWIYPAEHKGPVWFRLCPQPGNEKVSHKCKIRWGPWEYRIKVKFHSRSVALIHSKAHDGAPVPVFLTIEPETYSSFGTGSPVDTEIININFGWIRVE